jgi:hypothetical protein
MVFDPHEIRYDVMRREEEQLRREEEQQVSISSTFYLQIFCTNFVFLHTCN